MKVAFIVHVNTDDTDLISLANEMLEDLSLTFDVVEVKPWHRESLPTSPLVPPPNALGL